jgi:hypothetical protein
MDVLTQPALRLPPKILRCLNECRIFLRGLTAVADITDATTAQQANMLPIKY